MTPLGFFFGLAGVLYASAAMLVTLPWLLGRVSSRETGWLGRHVGRGFASDDDWRATCRFVARQVWLWSLPVLIGGVCAFVLPPKQHMWCPGLVIAAPLWLLGAAVCSYRYARRLTTAAQTASD